MASDKIISKIIQNAEEEAASIRAEAQVKADKASADIDKQMKEKLEKLKAKESEDVLEIARRSQLMTRLEARKNALAVKRSVIDDAFLAAKDALSALDNDRQEALITKIVVDACETGTEKLQVPKKDRDRYEKGFLAKLNAALEAASKPGKLTLDAVPAPFESGVMLIGEKSDVNGSFDVLLQDARNQYEREVAEMLFGTEV